MAALVPMDDRAPHRNQRHVECQSQSQEFVFGDCVRITGSIRPAGNYGPTVFQVDVPNKDSQPNTIIMGHKSSAASYPGTCTNDFPTYARIQQGAGVGEEVGPQSGSTILARGQKGYLVMGDPAFINASGHLMARVRRKDATPIGGILFQMTTDRSREILSGLPYGRATTTILDIWGDVPHSIGESVLVYFGGRLWLGAVTGCQGIAIWNEKQQSYIVHDCQSLAAWIRFQILQDRPPTTPNATVSCNILSIVNGNSSSFGGGIDNATYPPFDYLNAHGGVKVTYDGLEFPRALQNAVGKALLDIDYGTVVGVPSMRYHVVESDQFSPLARVVHGKFCPGASAPVSSSYPMMFFPHGQEPAPFQSALNPMSLASKGGAGVVAWDEYQQAWVMVVPKHEEMLLDRGLKEDGCKLGVYQQKFSVMTCEDEASWGCDSQDKQANPPACVELGEFEAVRSVHLEWDDYTCSLSVSIQKNTFCAFGDPDADAPYEDGGGATLTFDQVVVVVGIIEDGTCAYPVYGTITTVTCTSTPDEVVGDAFICVAECPQGS